MLFFNSAVEGCIWKVAKTLNKNCLSGAQMRAQTIDLQSKKPTQRDRRGQAEVNPPGTREGTDRHTNTAFQRNSSMCEEEDLFYGCSSLMGFKFSEEKKSKMTTGTLR